MVDLDWMRLSSAGSAASARFMPLAFQLHNAVPIIGIAEVLIARQQGLDRGIQAGRKLSERFWAKPRSVPVVCACSEEPDCEWNLICEDKLFLANRTMSCFNNLAESLMAGWGQSP